jgi:hypothetical protein
MSIDIELSVDLACATCGGNLRGKLKKDTRGDLSIDVELCPACVKDAENTDLLDACHQAHHALRQVDASDTSVPQTEKTLDLVNAAVDTLRGLLPHLHHDPRWPVSDAPKA